MYTRSERGQSKSSPADKKPLYENTVNGSLTAGTYSKTIYIYPEIATGTLEVYKGTNSIKDIQADVLE